MDTRAKLLDAATAVFAGQGYHRASMDQIAREAGVSKGAVYYFFQSKAALFREVIGEGLAYLRTHTDGLLQSGLPSETVLRHFVQAYVDMCLTYPRIASLLFTSRRDGLEESLADELEALVAAQAAQLGAVLEAGMADGFLRTADQQLCIGAFLGMLQGLCVRPRPGISRDAITATIAGLLLDGLRRRPDSPGEQGRG